MGKRNDEGARAQRLHEDGTGDHAVLVLTRFAWVVQGDSKELFRIYQDGKVVVAYDIYAAAMGFWDVVRDIAPPGRTVEIAAEMVNHEVDNGRVPCVACGRSVTRTSRYAGAAEEGKA